MRCGLRASARFRRAGSLPRLWSVPLVSARPASLYSPRGKQSKQIDLRLRRTAADHGALHGMIGAEAKALHHAAAHHAPAQRAHDFMEFHPVRIDLAPGGLIAREQLLARTEAADRLVDLAEAPGVDADPSQIFHGVANMGEFPVEHGAHAVGAD